MPNTPSPLQASRHYPDREQPPQPTRREDQTACANRATSTPNSKPSTTSRSSCVPAASSSSANSSLLPAPMPSILKRWPAHSSTRSSAPRPIRAQRRCGGAKATASFAANAGQSRTAPATLMREWLTTAAALRRTIAAIRRAEAARARTDTRAWMQDRRTRTRRLIELGGLVQKSGLPERLTALAAEDERAVILGALLMANQMLAGPNATSGAGDLITRWRKAGRTALRHTNQPETETTA